MASPRSTPQLFKLEANDRSTRRLVNPASLDSGSRGNGALSTSFAIRAFDFLGYTVDRFYGKGGRPYVGIRASREAVKSLLKRLHQRTTRQWYPDEPASIMGRSSGMVRGRHAYFAPIPG
jgi:hypothetical protein